MTRSTPARVATTAAALLSLALVSAPASAVVAAPSPFTALYVFGDSLSDAAGGNFLVPFAPNEGGLPVTAPYDLGRVSNGPVAAEYLGGLLGLSQAQQFHYAIAGARSGANGTIPGVGVVPTGLLTQVGSFALPGANAAYNSGSLFLVWAGANDLRDALQTANPTASFAGILGNLESAVTTLWQLGARDFLLPNIPNLGLTPAAQTLGPVASEGASFVTGLFNDAYASAVQGWAADLPGAHLYTFNTFTAHTQLQLGASQFGYTNLSNGCLVPVPGAADPQSACSVSFYVDDIHPTTSVHQILGQQMAAAVPEPQAMLLMATGALALLGLQRRRQRAAA